MDIEEMEKLYEKYKKNNYKNLTKGQAFDLVKKEIKSILKRNNLDVVVSFRRMR